MTKVYVLTADQYSAFHLCGIFSSRENAEKYMAAFPKREVGGYNEIEEWEIDNYLSEFEQGLIFWEVCMFRNGGLMRSVQRADSPDSESSDRWYKAGYGIFDWRRFCVWAKTPEAAVKIANERRVQIIAAEQGQGTDVSRRLPG